MVATLALCAAPASGDKKTGRQVIHIGMVQSCFRYTPEADLQRTTGPFRRLMEAQTGLKGKVVPGGNPFELAAKLNDNQLQLGVFHGFEFAWAQQRYPDLRPLIIAVNGSRHRRAFFIVPKDNGVSGFAALKGKSLAVPDETREECCLFLDRLCQAAGKKPGQYFSRMTTPSNSETALDDVAGGRVDMALIDQVALNSYQRRNPQRFVRLKVAEKSGIFPSPVVAYRRGSLDKKTLRAFRKGMLNAKKTTYGRQLLALNKLTACEPVPKDYAETLARVAKAYPPGATPPKR
jgi:ABC-type phosphate/phosphonate transport system substrate-binding protein